MNVVSVALMYWEEIEDVVMPHPANWLFESLAVDVFRCIGRSRLRRN